MSTLQEVKEIITEKLKYDEFTAAMIISYLPGRAERTIYSVLNQLVQQGVISREKESKIVIFRK